MGTYIYQIADPKRVAIVRLDTGNILKVAKYSYSHKPTSTFNDPPRWQRLAEARISKAEYKWVKHVRLGGKWPDAGVMVGGNLGDGKADWDVKVGDSVMAWPTLNGLPCAIDDCTFGNAKIVGKVAEVLLD